MDNRIGLHKILCNFSIKLGMIGGDYLISAESWHVFCSACPFLISPVLLKSQGEFVA
jgi:hypothetical protein